MSILVFFLFHCGHEKGFSFCLISRNAFKIYKKCCKNYKMCACVKESEGLLKINCYLCMVITNTQ